MARVPTLQTNINPTIGPSLTSGVRSSPAAFGASVGRGVEQLGSTVSQVASNLASQQIEQQDQDNKRAIATAQIEQKRQLLSIKQEFDLLKGQEAVDRTDEFKERIDNVQTDLSGNFSNDVAKRDFLLESALDQVNFSDNLLRSSETQRQVANRIAADTVLTEEQNIVTANFFDDDQVALSIARIGVQARASAIEAGFSEEEADVSAGKFESSAVKTAIVAALAARNTKRAEELFKGEFGTLLKGDDLISVEKMVSGAVDLEFAQEQADVVASLAQKPDGTIDFEKAVKLLRETPGLKGQQLQDALTELDKRISEANDFKIQRVNAAESDLDQHLAQGGALSEWTAQNPDLWEEIQSDSVVFNRIQAYREGQASLQLFAGVSDGITWRRMMTMRSADLVKLDVEAFRGQLTESEFNSVTLAQKSAINSAEGGTQTASQARAIFKNARTIMDAAANSIPSIRDEDPSAESGIRFLLDRRMDEFVQRFTDSGKEPTAEQLNAEASRLILTIQSGDPGWTVWGLKWAGIGQDEDFFEGLAARAGNLSVRQRQSAIVPVESMTVSQKETWTALYLNNDIEPTDNLLEQMGGAVAVNDIRRQRRLLVRKRKPKAKTESSVTVPLGDQ